MTPQRRKLVAIDDPLAVGPLPEAPALPSVERRRPPADEESAALYVRLRLAESDRLARAAFELRVHKRELIGALIAKHVDGTTADGLEALRGTIEEYRQLSR